MKTKIETIKNAISILFFLACVWVGMYKIFQWGMTAMYKAVDWMMETSIFAHMCAKIKNFFTCVHNTVKKSVSSSSDLEEDFELEEEAVEEIRLFD